jgi:hypothetical protein
LLGVGCFMVSHAFPLSSAPTGAPYLPKPDHRTLRAKLRPAG